ncbi:MAG: alanine:cation symporter family protein [Alphaproteobacteria bacterium]|nr:alanine:cation symporter family protein [Alphaproteobacteria bacterium]MBP7761869.1 alanine:cation symporter family protein [Alphaproteobacteria bacterium]MBP7904686.1 alanine:cation symporter family protein [Alphaproteobacteria bacterium]
MSADLAPTAPGIDKTIDGFFQPLMETSSDLVFWGIYLGQCKAEEMNIYPETWKGLQVLKPYLSLPFDACLQLKFILIWLAAVAVFFTFYLGFISIRYFGRSIKMLFGEGSRVSGDGEISQYQALMASLSGTVGLGNIAGVAVAISTGGPGAAFWMTLMGFFGMSSKFAEVMLGVKYRQRPDPDHPTRISGGPMYYLKAAFEARGMPSVGTFFAVFFALCCIIGTIGGGNMYQANQTYKQILVATGGDASMFVGYGWAFGVVLAFFTGAVIIGGLKSIAAVASKLVPVMGIIYFIAGFVIIAMHIDNLIPSLITIVTSAFSLKAGFGALLGGLLIGVQRAAFSNEAGLGSAAIVQSTTNTDGPVGTGIVAMLGPFIDTIIICNITALVIVITGVYTEGGGMEGVELTSRAFSDGISWFPYVLTITVVLFAYSTMISWYYCGAVCVRYVFGEKDWVETVFKVFYLLCTVVGTSAELSNLINFTDAAMMSMAFPNILGLFILAPEIKRDLKEYLLQVKNSG